MRRVSAKEAKALIDTGWVYLDVRTEPEFDAGHPAGAMNVPLLHAGSPGMMPNPDFERVVASAISKDAKVVVGCQVGNRSLRAAKILEAAGWREVADMRPGFGGARDQFGRIVEAGWEAEGLPVEAGAPAGRSYADLVIAYSFRR